MQQESNAKNSRMSKISIESLGSNLSNFSFLKDVPNQNRQSYRDSLKYYQSISDKKSDIYENLINQQVKMKSIHGSGLGRSGKPDSMNSFAMLRGSYDQRKNKQYFNSQFQLKQIAGSNISEQNKDVLVKNQIMHTCLCVQSCQKKQCPCFTAENDQCIPLFCCPNCVQQKILIMSGEKPISLGMQVQIEDDMKPCTCKKTKCNKKYCACFAAGRKCTQLCTCDQCTNCDFYECELKPQTKPKTYIEQQYQSKHMPQKMDFEPCEFPQL